MRVVLVEPNSLVGKELREILGASHGDRFQIDLATVAVDELGTLTEIEDEAAIVASLTEGSARAADAVVLCGTPAEQQRALAMLPEDGPTTIVIATELDHPAGELSVAGFESDSWRDERTLVSPYPATVALAHLLAPLVSRGLRRAAATVLLPASSADTAGLDELFGQTRSLLNFESERPTAVYGYQLAFNHLPGPSGEPIRRQLGQILGDEPEITVQLVQSPVFHGLAVSLYVELEDRPQESALADALAASPFVEPFDPDQGLGPVDAAQRDEILLGRVRADPATPGGYWLWAVMDNLRRGGASNVVALLEGLAADRAAN